VLRSLFRTHRRQTRYIHCLLTSQRLYSVSDVATLLASLHESPAERRARHEAQMLEEQSAKEERAARAKSPAPPTMKPVASGLPTSPPKATVPFQPSPPPRVDPKSRPVRAAPEVVYRRARGTPASRGEDDR
jgi:hypothetical protein